MLICTLGQNCGTYIHDIYEYHKHDMAYCATEKPNNRLRRWKSLGYCFGEVRSIKGAVKNARSASAATCLQSLPPPWGINSMNCNHLYTKRHLLRLIYTYSSESCRILEWKMHFKIQRVDIQVWHSFVPLVGSSHCFDSKFQTTIEKYCWVDEQRKLALQPCTRGRTKWPSTLAGTHPVIFGVSAGSQSLLG